MRSAVYDVLQAFDFADPSTLEGNRATTTVAPQALFMMNDPFAHEQADKFAVRIGLAQTDVSERIDYAYRLAFGRAASPDEIKAGRNYLREYRRDLLETKVPKEQQPRVALASFCRVLFSSNEFLFID